MRALAIIGIQVISLVLDPVSTCALLAPLFVLMDLVAPRCWRPAAWPKPDLRELLPGLVVGIAASAFLLRMLPGGAVAIPMAIVTLTFCSFWLVGSGQIGTRPMSVPLAMTAGFGSGVTTIVAHSRGPPLALYLLRLGLPKTVYPGTTSLFFTVGNLIKVVPWLWLAKPCSEIWLLMAIVLPVIPVGVRLGWMFHE